MGYGVETTSALYPVQDLRRTEEPQGLTVCEQEERGGRLWHEVGGMFETASRGHGYCAIQTRACWLQKQVGESLCSAVCTEWGREARQNRSLLLRKPSAKAVPPRNNFPVRADQFS